MTSRMPGWSYGGGQRRLIKAAQLCWCACVCKERDGVESWNDEVPLLPPGEEGRDTERAKRVHAIVDEGEEEARRGTHRAPPPGFMPPRSRCAV